MQSVSIKVYFNSCLDRDEVAKEAARLTAIKLEEEQQQQQQAQEATAQLECEQTTVSYNANLHCGITALPFKAEE